MGERETLDVTSPKPLPRESFSESTCRTLYNILHYRISKADCPLPSPFALSLFLMAEAKKNPAKLGYLLLRYQCKVSGVMALPAFAVEEAKDSPDRLLISDQRASGVGSEYLWRTGSASASQLEQSLEAKEGFEDL